MSTARRAAPEHSETDEVRTVVREELRAARDEDRDYLQRLAQASAILAAAGLLLFLGTVFLALMLVYILGELIEPWIGAAIVGLAITTSAVVATRWAWRRAHAILER